MEVESDEGFWSVDQILEDEESFQRMHAAESAREATDALVKQHKPQLTVEKRRKIVDTLLAMEQGERLPYGSRVKVAKEVGVHKSTITRLYKYMCNKRNQGELIDVRSKKEGRVGPKPRDLPDEVLQSVPLQFRTTVRSFAKHLNVSHVTVHRLKKRGRLRSHTSNNHPRLSTDHKIARLKWVLSNIIPALPHQKAVFDDMQNVLHTDEKWFYLNPETRRFYLLPKEDDPYRCEVSKRYKVKAMFMAVIGRPLYDEYGGLVHDGKYGIFPFIYHKRAAKNSKNRAAGTWEVKALQNVTRHVVREMLVNKIIPCIKEKWPQQLGKDVYIQWDNARPHQIPTDQEWLEMTKGDGWNINMIFQPAQSPDLNVLDLGLFSSIQSIQYHSFPRNIQELITEVKQAYETFDPLVNRFTWLTLQSCMIEILKQKGGNNYKIQHCHKHGLEDLGILPENLQVDQAVVDEGVKYLDVMFRDWSVRGQEDVETQEEIDAD